MREILFRGKRLDNGEWVEGWYQPETTIKHWDGIQETVGVTIAYNVEDGFLEDTLVDPPTVGQYTGLKDKNGKRVFEGDIIHYNTYDDFGCHSVVRFGKYEQDGSCGEYDSTDCIGWYVEVYGLICPDWAEDEPMYFNDYLRQQNLLEVIFKCEVIGNIHDNPELLKGGEG